MLRPESWSRLTGVSPVRVGTGVPGSRPRFVVETRRAERGVKSLFGGSKRAGRSIKRTLQPRHIHNGGAEPLMSRRRPCPAGPVPGSAFRVPSGYGGRHARTVWAGTGEARLPGLRRAKTEVYKPMVKSPGGQRESEGAVVPLIGVQQTRREGRALTLIMLSARVSIRAWPGFPVEFPGRLGPAVAGRAPLVLVWCGRTRERARTAAEAMDCGQAVCGAAFPRPV